MLFLPEVTKYGQTGIGDGDDFLTACGALIIKAVSHKMLMCEGVFLGGDANRRTLILETKMVILGAALRPRPAHSGEGASHYGCRTTNDVQ